MLSYTYITCLVETQVISLTPAVFHFNKLQIWGTSESRFDYQQKQRFFFLPLTFGKSQSPIQCVFEVLSPLVKWTKRGVHYLYLALWLRKPGIHLHIPISRHVNTGTSY